MQYTGFKKLKATLSDAWVKDPNVLTKSIGLKRKNKDVGIKIPSSESAIKPVKVKKLY